MFSCPARHSCCCILSVRLQTWLSVHKLQFFFSVLDCKHSSLLKEWNKHIAQQQQVTFNNYSFVNLFPLVKKEILE